MFMEYYAHQRGYTLARVNRTVESVMTEQAINFSHLIGLKKSMLLMK
jgi:hypothetical protein